MTAPAAGTTRTKILETVTRFPGIHLRALEREAGLSSSLIVYHLEDLEREGLLLAEEINGYTRYFPGPRSRGPHLDRADRALLGVMREKVPLELTLHLLERGALKHKDLAELLDLSKGTVTYHLKKLADLGIVVKTPRGEEKGFTLAEPERVRKLIQQYRPTPETVDEFAELWDDFYGGGGEGPSSG